MSVMSTGDVPPDLSRRALAPVMLPPVDALADRFFTAWKRLEKVTGERWRDAHPRQAAPDSATVLLWAQRTQLLTDEAADFVRGCRAARNAYAHVSFDGYQGPVAHPPAEVVHRLERLVGNLEHPAKLSSVAPRAITCANTDSVFHALGLMRSGDFSQVPYLHGNRWMLITREQVSRWLEAEAAVERDRTALLDLDAPVHQLAEHPGVGPVLPRLLSAGSTVPDGVRELEAALRTPDVEPGGYPLVLLLAADSRQGPRVLAADDLPHLYDLMGR